MHLFHIKWGKDKKLFRSIGSETKNRTFTNWLFSVPGTLSKLLTPNTMKGRLSLHVKIIITAEKGNPYVLCNNSAIFQRVEILTSHS